MKLVTKPIEMIVNFNIKCEVKPERFRLVDEEGETIVINIDRIRSFEIEKVGRSKKYFYECECIIDDHKKIYIIKYDLNACTWILFKW